MSKPIEEHMSAANIPISMSIGAHARLGGLLYVITIALGLFRELFVKRQVIVPGDMAATATRLEQFAFWWRMGIAAELAMVLCSVLLTWVLYVLLRPTAPRLAQLMVYFGLTALAVEGACSVLLIQAVLPVTATYLQALDSDLRYAMVGMALRAHEYGFGIALLMFGPFFLVAGLLLRRSGLFPSAVGVLYQISGAGYLLHGFVLVLVPNWAGMVFTAVAPVIFIGEATFCVWLLFKEVDETRWRQLANQESTP